MADMNPKRVNAITIRFDDSEWRNAAQEELRKCQQDAISLQNELSALRGQEPVAPADTLVAIADEFAAAIPTPQGRLLAAMIREGVTALQSHIIAAMAPTGWQPIETAPQDGTVVLVYPGTWSGRSVSTAVWDAQHFASRPRPYWRRDDAIGARDSRDKPPTHWMPLPNAPQKGGL